MLKLNFDGVLIQCKMCSILRKFLHVEACTISGFHSDKECIIEEKFPCTTEGKVTCQLNDPKCSTLYVGSSDTNIRTRSTNCRNHIYEPSKTVVKWPLTSLNIKASKPCPAWMGVRIRREWNCHTTINWMIKQSSYWLANKFILQMQLQRRKESWLLNQKADGS